LELPQDGWLGCTSGEASLELPKDGWLGCISGEVPLSFELRTLGSFELSKRGSPILNALTACPSIRGGCSSDAGGELGSRVREFRVSNFGSRVSASRMLNALSTLSSRACSLIRGGCSSEEGDCLPFAISAAASPLPLAVPPSSLEQPAFHLPSAVPTSRCAEGPRLSRVTWFRVSGFGVGSRASDFGVWVSGDDKSGFARRCVSRVTCHQPSRLDQSHLPPTPTIRPSRLHQPSRLDRESPATRTIRPNRPTSDLKASPYWGVC